jgi:hypothetical protein
MSPLKVIKSTEAKAETGSDFVYSARGLAFIRITFGPDRHETDCQDPVKSATSAMTYDI